MTAFARPDIRHWFYKKLGRDDLGWYGTAATISGTALTDALNLAGANEGDNLYDDGIIYFPNETGNDVWKFAGLHTAPTIAHASSLNWSGTLTAKVNQPYEWMRGGLTPDVFNECIRKGARDLVFETYTPLGDLFEDSDFADSDTDSWVGSSADITIEKTTQQAYNRTGYRSLLLTHNASRVYATAAVPYACQPGDQLYFGALPIIAATDSHATGGPATFTVWDVTHNVALDTVTFTGKTPQHYGRVITMPPGCYAVNVRMGAAQGSIVAWDALPNHDLEAQRVTLPTGLDRGWKLLGFEQAGYGRNVATNVQNAHSRVYRAWKRLSDFSPENLNEDADPRSLQILHPDGLPDADMWFHFRQRESERVTLEDETSSINVEDEEMLMAAVGVYLYDVLYQTDKQQRWRDLKDEAQMTVDAQKLAVEHADPLPFVTTYTPGAPGGRFSVG